MPDLEQHHFSGIGEWKLWQNFFHRYARITWILLVCRLVQFLSVCMKTISQCNIASDMPLNLLWNGYCDLLYIKYFLSPYYELYDILKSDLMMQTRRIARSGTSFVGLILLRAYALQMLPYILIVSFGKNTMDNRLFLTTFYGGFYLKIQFCEIQIFFYNEIWRTITLNINEQNLNLTPHILLLVGTSESWRIIWTHLHYFITYSDNLVFILIMLCW